MRAFEVYLNGKKLCVAGIGDDGVLTTIVSWVTGKSGSDCFLEVGGLISPIKEHVRWVHREPLNLGDKIQVSLLAADTVDKPAKSTPHNPQQDFEAKKIYVRRMAKELGWKIQEGPKNGSPKKRKRK